MGRLCPSSGPGVPRSFPGEALSADKPSRGATCLTHSGCCELWLHLRVPKFLKKAPLKFPVSFHWKEPLAGHEWWPDPCGYDQHLEAMSRRRVSHSPERCSHSAHTPPGHLLVGLALQVELVVLQK